MARVRRSRLRGESWGSEARRDDRCRSAVCGSFRSAPRSRVAKESPFTRSGTLRSPSQVRRRFTGDDRGCDTHPAPSKRAGTPFRARQRGVSLSKRAKPQLACSKPVSLGLLQEALRTAALAKRTRDAPSMRARLSLCAQRFRGWARVGGRRVSRSLNRRVARTPPLADRMGRKSLWVSRGAGCWVKTGSAPLERSLPSGSGALVRSRTVAKRDPRVMSANVATSLFRSIRLGVRPPTGFPRRRGAELRATMLRARGPRA